MTGDVGPDRPNDSEPGADGYFGQYLAEGAYHHYERFLQRLVQLLRNRISAVAYVREPGSFEIRIEDIEVAYEEFEETLLSPELKARQARGFLSGLFMVLASSGLSVLLTLFATDKWQNNWTFLFGALFVVGIVGFLFQQFKTE